MTPNFPNIAILGLGLIGSSLARAVHAANLAERITGYDLNPEASAYGVSEGYLTASAATPAAAVHDAHLVILAAPIRQLPALMCDIAPHLKPGATITDISSVKSYITAEVAPLVPTDTYFIPGHPIAGRATSGHLAGTDALFDKRRIILMPGDEYATRRVIAFWEALGGQVEVMDAETHDLVYAYLSHLPQLLAYAAVETLAAHPLSYPLPESFLPFIRLGGSNPVLWTDIFLTNHDAIIGALDMFLQVADHIRQELSSGKQAGEPSVRASDVPTLLFPRLVASCFVTAISVFERHVGGSLARYAGTGFADFASPVLTAPEEDIEKISQHYEQISELLLPMIQNCRDLREMMVLGQDEQLLKRLTRMQQSHAQLMEPRN